MIALLILLGSESRKITTDLRSISDEIFKEQFHWDQAQCDNFLWKLSFLSGKLQTPSIPTADGK